MDGEPQRGIFNESKLSSAEVKAVVKTIFNIAQLEQTVIGYIHLTYNATDEVEKNEAIQNIAGAATTMLNRLEQNVLLLEKAAQDSPDSADLQRLVEIEKEIKDEFESKLTWVTSESVVKKQCERLPADTLATFFETSFASVRSLLDEFGKIPLVETAKDELQAMGVSYVELPHYRGTLPTKE